MAGQHGYGLLAAESLEPKRRLRARPGPRPSTDSPAATCWPAPGRHRRRSSRLHDRARAQGPASTRRRPLLCRPCRPLRQPGLRGRCCVRERKGTARTLRVLLRRPPLPVWTLGRLGGARRPMSSQIGRPVGPARAGARAIAALAQHRILDLPKCTFFSTSKKIRVYASSLRIRV